MTHENSPDVQSVHETPDIAAALERVRDTLRYHDNFEEARATLATVEAHIEKMEAALREIAGLDPDWTHRDQDSVYAIARCALNEEPT